jgi:cell division protease FtsH
MGVTLQLPAQERYVYKREHLLARIAVMLGGRAAEDLVFKPMAAGGHNRQVFLGEEIAQRPRYSEATARELDEEVKRILDRAIRVLREDLEPFEREEITGGDVTMLVAGTGSA